MEAPPFVLEPGVMSWKLSERDKRMNWEISSDRFAFDDL